MSTNPKQLAEDFVVFTPEMNAVVEPNRATLYQELQQSYSGFVGHTLVAQYHFSQSWPSWEVHPHGDELVTLISGRVTLVLETGSGEECVELGQPGDYLLVPRNTWHTARMERPCTLLFFTPGAGTQHRDA